MPSWCEFLRARKEYERGESIRYLYMDSQFLLRYCLYSLPGKWVYYFERSKHGNRYGTKTDYLFQCIDKIARKIPKRGKYLLSFLTRLILLFLFYRVAVEVASVFMDELSRAVAQFYPSSSGGMGGGFNQPPSPEGAGALPVVHENQDQPGPSASEGGGRDYTYELREIQSYREDVSLNVSYRNALIRQERIIIEFKKCFLRGNQISDESIRSGVESYLTRIMGLSRKYRRQRLSDILKDLTDNGSASTYFRDIVTEISSVNRLKNPLR